MNNLIKYTVLFVLITSAFFSCGEGDELPEIPNTDNQSNLLNSKINISVRVCENLFCTESKELSDIEVKLKRDDSESFYRTASSDTIGEIFFTSINVSPLTVIANYDGQEFQENITVGKDEVIYINILFSPFCEMDGSRLVNCNTKIDFEHMSVGQESRYVLYKTNEKQLGDDKSFQYTEDTLVLKVIDQISTTQWIVQEELLNETEDSLFEYRINTKPTICIWDVHENFLKIFPTQGNEPSNFTSLRHFDHETYEIPLIASGFNSCEMDLWYPIGCDNEGTPRIFGVEFNGKTYSEELILDRRYGIDTPQFGIIYSKEEGIVHSYVFGEIYNTHAYGFDLIVE